MFSVKQLFRLIAVLGFLPLAAQAEVVEIAGKVEAFFPEGKHQAIVVNEHLMHGGYADERDWTFYTFVLYQNHGQSPSQPWFRNFVKGQESSVPIQHGKSQVINTSSQNGDIHGSFSLSGKLDGAPYEKLCRFIMNSDDYATWCVGVISDRANTDKAYEHFRKHGAQFRLTQR